MRTVGYQQLMAGLSDVGSSHAIPNPFAVANMAATLEDLCMIGRWGQREHRLVVLLTSSADRCIDSAVANGESL